MMLNIATVRPMPSDSAALPAMSVAGLRRSDRKPSRKSRSTDVELHTRARLCTTRRRRPITAPSNASSRSWRSNRSRAAVAPICGVSSVNCCSRCWATSSTMSASSSDLNPDVDSRARTSARQSNDSGDWCDSRISHPRDAVDCRHEFTPPFALGDEWRAAGGRQAVEAAPTLARLLVPSPRDPSAILEPIEQRIERGDVKHQHALRPRLDELLKLVPMPVLGLEQRQYEEFGTAFLQFVGEHRWRSICGTDTYSSAPYGSVNGEA